MTRKFEAKNNIIIAEMLNSPYVTNHENGFIYTMDEIPIYKVISVGKDTNFKIDDIIICASTGSRIDKDNKLYMFENSSVIGTIDKKTQNHV